MAENCDHNCSGSGKSCESRDMRAKLREAEGYETQILEFIDMEHTPKNLLIRAVKTGNADKKALSDAAKMSKELNINLTLMKLLED